MYQIARFLHERKSLNISSFVAVISKICMYARAPKELKTLQLYTNHLTVIPRTIIQIIITVLHSVMVVLGDLVDLGVLGGYQILVVVTIPSISHQMDLLMFLDNTHHLLCSVLIAEVVSPIKTKVAVTKIIIEIKLEVMKIDTRKIMIGMHETTQIRIGTLWNNMMIPAVMAETKIQVEITRIKTTEVAMEAEPIEIMIEEDIEVIVGKKNLLMKGTRQEKRKMARITGIREIPERTGM